MDCHEDDGSVDPPDKVGRKDVSERLQENKKFNFRIIKSTLNSFIVDDKEIRKIVKEPIDYILRESNKAQLEAYNLANLYTNLMISKGLSVDPDQVFYYRCLTAVTGIKYYENEDFNTAVIMYRTNRPVNYVLADSSYISTGIYQNMSKQMKTNSYNSIQTRFYKLFYKYLKHKYSLDSDVAYDILYNVQLDSYEGLNIIVHRYREKLLDVCRRLNVQVKKDLGFYEIVQQRHKNNIEKIKKTEDLEKEKLAFEEFQKAEKIRKDTELTRKVEGDKLKTKKQLKEEKAQFVKDERIRKANIRSLEKIEQIKEKELKFIEKEKAKFLKKMEPDVTTMSDLFKIPKVLLPILYEILKHNELSQNKNKSSHSKKIDKGIRTFSLLPTKNGFTISHIKICKSGLFSLLKHIERMYPEELYNILETELIDLKTLNLKTFKGLSEMLSMLPTKKILFSRLKLVFQV